MWGAGVAGAGRKPVMGPGVNIHWLGGQWTYKSSATIDGIGIGESARTVPPHLAGRIKRHILGSFPVM